MTFEVLLLWNISFTKTVVQAILVDTKSCSEKMFHCAAILVGNTRPWLYPGGISSRWCLNARFTLLLHCSASNQRLRYRRRPKTPWLLPKICRSHFSACASSIQCNTSTFSATALQSMPVSWPARLPSQYRKST